MKELWDHIRGVWPAVTVFLAIWWPIAIIVAKMGFPRWLGWVGGVLVVLAAALSWELAGVGVCAFLLFAAMREWPLHRELTYARVHGGLGTEMDAYSLLERAVERERKGHWEEATRLCEEVLARFTGTRPGDDAAIAIERLKNRQRIGAQ